MDETTRVPDLRQPAVWLTAILATALIYPAYHLVLAARSNDSNHLETTLALVIERELQDGPGTLYGPFTGRMPLVLIHAPLYYRLAAVGTWGLVRLGMDPLTASFASGRLISILGFLAIVALVFRIARLDGAPRQAATWAALLVASSPILARLPVAVRADSLGIALQTLGLWLVLRAWLAGATRFGELAGAYVAFGLALCVKQHLVWVPALSSALLVVAWWRGRARLAAIVTAHALGGLVTIGYYGLEEIATSGQMSWAVFRLPGALRQISYGGWEQVRIIWLDAAKRSIGLIALVAAGVAVNPRRFLGGDRFDAVLMAFLAGEVVLTTVLCLGNSASGVNYALPAAIFACLLIGRAFERLLTAEGVPGWRLVPVGLGALLVLATVGRLIVVSATIEHTQLAAIQGMLADPRVARCSASERYFVGTPEHNRIFGRPELAYDEWLYDAFERISAAEPRQIWLRAALTTGPVRQVIVPADAAHNPQVVPGLAETLPELGYRWVDRLRGFDVWERALDARQLRARRQEAPEPWNPSSSPPTATPSSVPSAAHG